jgi:hypothetical protein
LSSRYGLRFWRLDYGGFLRSLIFRWRSSLYQIWQAEILNKTEKQISTCPATEGDFLGMSSIIGIRELAR